MPVVWPEYVGPLAYGVRMGTVKPGDDLPSIMLRTLARCRRDGLLGSGDVVCVTESVVARAQSNYVTLDRVAGEARRVLGLAPGDCLGIVLPIASRNRFSLALKGLARAVPRGRVVVQMSFPSDEVGNQIVDPAALEAMGACSSDVIRPSDLPAWSRLHPVTGVDYLALYRDMIEAGGAAADIILANDPLAVLAEKPDAVIAADIHTREKTRRSLEAGGARVVTLQDLCRDGTGPEGWCEWGLLGSNMSSGERLKLAPRDAPAFARELQALVRSEIGIEVGVIVYGDGAYKDPTTGIWELADPRPAFGASDDLAGRMREGIKYKLFADMLLERGMSDSEIDAVLTEKKQSRPAPDSIDTEGTTPRRLEDIVSSLADLVSGSADAGTPVVIVRGFLGNGS